ncbi:hypothetical protein FF1_023522 [Malus domestica]
MELEKKKDIIDDLMAFTIAENYGWGIIVITTNHVEQLDPALVRKGRMYKHIELLYCKFEAFKVLVGNYLRLQSHDLFSTIVRCRRKTDRTPADVAEPLMPKTNP